MREWKQVDVGLRPRLASGRPAHRSRCPALALFWTVMSGLAWIG